MKWVPIGLLVHIADVRPGRRLLDLFPEVLLYFLLDINTVFYWLSKILPEIVLYVIESPVSKVGLDGSHLASGYPRVLL